MAQDILTREDLLQIEEHGLTQKEILRQLDYLRTSSPYVKVIRPCTPGDGIKIIQETEADELQKTYEVEAQNGRCLKFVPASGAASRMFRTPLRYLDKNCDVRREVIARKGGKDAKEILRCVENITRFAFSDELKKVMSKKGLVPELLLDRGQFREILHFLLTPEGLDYANMPKGLLKFHRYGEQTRTAFEEHLVEAAHYLADKTGLCRLQFTILPEHRTAFLSLLKSVRDHYESKYLVTFEVDFSLQKSSTDTVAVDNENRLFRNNDGRILFRPGGHGALVENLNDLKGDLIFIKNIDNVVPDRLKEDTIRWKKILGGYLVTVQSRVFRYLDMLSSGPTKELLVEDALDFARDELSIAPPVGRSLLSQEAKRKFLLDKLNRPIRVCGMVVNEGEPGGGPFWVEDDEGERSIQIVESAQIDPDSGEQTKIFSSSTHFNPVDIVCGVRDWQGEPFDLRQYVDQGAAFIARKSEGGKDLKALEHPGLWNGAMAHWITILVEVPIITFNPVKTINDLLRKEHQPF